MRTGLFWTRAKRDCNFSAAHGFWTPGILRILATNICHLFVDGSEYCPNNHLPSVAIELRYVAGDLQALADEIDQSCIGMVSAAGRILRYTGKLRRIKNKFLWHGLAAFTVNSNQKS
jgi:hypothetical protein